MKESVRRSILRSIHILFGMTLLAYIYGPPEETRQYLPYFRNFYMPVVVVTGFWLWKGAAIRRLFSKGSAEPEARPK